MSDCCYCNFIYLGTAFAVLAYIANKLYFSGGICRSKNRLDGKTAIVTGANTGIGYETALDFARRGARVILACRDSKKSEKAVNEIIKLTDNKKVEFEYLDLADLETVKDFAKKMNSTLNRLDLLVNNAGIMACPNWRTKQGFEMQFGVNHLGHFLLTNLLLDLLKKSESSRIVNVSSLAHMGGGINWNDINSEKSYSSFQAYSQSKSANILFSYELAKRLKGTGVTAYSLHPGSVRTELTRYTSESIFRYLPLLLNTVFYPFFWVISKSPLEGAQTTIHCSISDEALKNNGDYFSDCAPKTPARTVTKNKDENAAKLWEKSFEMIRAKINID